MSVIFEKSRVLTDVALSYCPGCTHGIAHRLLAEAIDGLDIEGMVEMRNLFLRLAREYDSTFFISSHLIHDVELTCDRIGILHEGRLLRAESMENIKKNYSSLENFYLSEVGVSVNSANVG